MRPRRRWRDPGLWITVVAFACLVMLAASYMQLSVVAGNNHVLLREQVRQEHLLADCTTPGGQCFERAQKQTAGAVQTLVIRLSVGMCRLVYPHADAAEIERCVTRVTKE